MIGFEPPRADSLSPYPPNPSFARSALKGLLIAVSPPLLSLLLGVLSIYGQMFIYAAAIATAVTPFATVMSLCGAAYLFFADWPDLSFKKRLLFVMSSALLSFVLWYLSAALCFANAQARF